MKRLYRTLIVPVRVSVLSVLFLWGTQDIQIFPGALYSLAGVPEMRAVSPDVEQIIVNTSDGVPIEVWRVEGANDTGPLAGKTAIVFRGNGGGLAGFLPTQTWLAGLGANTYMFNYRGYGNSGGWPSEKGINLDADAVWKYAAAREGATPEQLALVAISVGTGPAARLAAELSPKMLILFSAYSSIPSAAAAQPLLGWAYKLLDPLISYRFPTAEYVAKLQRTCLFVVHGEGDQLIPASEGRKVAAAYRGTGYLFTLFEPRSGHVAFFDTKDRVAAALAECR